MTEPLGCYLVWSPKTRHTAKIHTDAIKAENEAIRLNMKFGKAAPFYVLFVAGKVENNMITWRM